MQVEPPPGTGATLQFQLVKIERGVARLEGQPGRYAPNPLTTVHGGFAMHSQLGPDQGFTTLELKLSYLKTGTERTGPVQAVGRILQLSRRVAFAEASLTDAAGTLLASATSTLLILRPISETLGIPPSASGEVPISPGSPAPDLATFRCAKAWFEQHSSNRGTGLNLSSGNEHDLAVGAAPCQLGVRLAHPHQRISGSHRDHHLTARHQLGKLSHDR
jgi:acyl-coenzyme A thioesterase PaaI-like protein